MTTIFFPLFLTSRQYDSYTPPPARALSSSAHQSLHRNTIEKAYSHHTTMLQQLITTFGGGWCFSLLCYTTITIMLSLQKIVIDATPDFVHGIRFLLVLVSLPFLVSGNVYGWSTLKIMLHIAGFWFPPPSHVLSSPFFSLSHVVVTQIRGHIACSSPPSPLRAVPIIIARRLQPYLSSLVDLVRYAALS